MSQPQILDANLRFTGPFTPRKKTDLLVLHHAAATQCTVEDVHRWHLARGWLGIGYHYFVRKDGSIWRGRPEDAIGAHTEGHNDHSIGICAEGDFSKEQMPIKQQRAISDLVAWIVSRYPGTAVGKHSGLCSTECPGENYPFDQIIIVAIGTPILGQAQATVDQAQAWAKARGAAQCFIDVAPLYWQEAAGRGGVRPEVAYAQSAKETGFGRFGGVIPGPEWHNWCGLKTSGGGANNDPNAHAQFPDDLTGVQAHLDHLALYAGAPGYPLSRTSDPRHFAFIRGTAITVEGLSGRWAPSPDYGASIVRDYLAGLLATPVPDMPAEDPEKEELKRLVNDLQTEVARLTGYCEQLETRIREAKSALGCV